ncbi:glycosyltransferase family 4 protein [Teichococcus vastitatis]|uniref:glycosyltransferase family 4 protein n=1 Tax=Teichococcus vastitatis TaxID=2307076 RepID=UPI000E70A937|nr:glycosyltransferase family 4 protein [Pseudoroseomonas vastitatis]
MRLLYLHQHYSAPEGATATRSHALAHALVRRGHAVTLACGRYEGAVTGLDGPFAGGRRDGTVHGLRLVEFDIPCGNSQGFGARAAAFGRYAARAGRLAAGGDWDLVIASSTPLTVALPALLARRLRGTPFLFEIRDPWPELPRAMGGVPGWALAGMGHLADAACRQAAAVVALSEGMAQTALSRGAAPERVHVVPNGCDLDLFGPHIPAWRPMEAAPWEMLAVYAGAHGRANGLEQLLDAAALLLARGEHRIRLMLVGEGSEKPRLQEAAATRGLHNLSFMAPLGKRKLASLLAGAQVGLHCLAPVAEFAEWTAPNKLMDYLAAGLPVVSNLPGHGARLLAEGPCGIATTPGDPAALAAALSWMANNPSPRIAMGHAAREQAVRRWDRRLLARDFVAIAESAAESSSLVSLVAA